MPAKDLVVKEAIQAAIGSTRRGRNKIIRKVQKVYPNLGARKIRRVCVREGFSLPQKPRKRMKNNPANAIIIDLVRNEEWAIEFMANTLVNGRTLKIFNVIEHYIRQCYWILNLFSLTHQKPTAFQDQLIENYGKPKRLRGDNGPELMAKCFKTWLRSRTNQLSV